MRGVYTATARITSLNAAKTLMYLTVPANKVIEILSASVTNDSNATNEQERVSIKRVSSLGTPTATATTPAPMEFGDQAAGTTIFYNVTASEPTYGQVITAEAWSSLGGFYFDPVPEERPIINGGATVGIYMESTPTAFNCDLRVTFREIG